MVIITRNRRPAVLATLRRLENSGAAGIVVVDNGSEDGTTEAVRSAAPDATVIRLPVNIGAAARTVGVCLARTPYVAFCDDDSWWPSESLDRAAEALDAQPHAGLLAARVLVGEGDEIDPVTEEMRHSPLRAADRTGTPRVMGFTACGAVVRRTAYLGSGGFEPLLHFLGEEELLAHDLAALGWEAVFDDEVVARHLPDTAGDRTTETERRRGRLQHRNALLSQWLRRPLPVVVRGVVRSGMGRGPERAALSDALRRLPDVLARRRLLPPEVESEVRAVELRGRVASDHPQGGPSPRRRLRGLLR